MAKFKFDTKQTVARTYTIEAEDADQARERAKVYFRDPDIFGGRVNLIGEEAVTALKIENVRPALDTEPTEE